MSASNSPFQPPRRAVLLGLAATTSLAAGGVHAQTPAPYRWRNAVVGGGGFIPGVVFSRVRKGLAYLRSDMGGAYRWDADAGVWTPLLDQMALSSWQGVESVAPDPVDPDVVYLACGMSHDEDAVILRSANRGQDWTAAEVPFRMGGNEDGRGLGERLAIDPNLTSTLYFGSRHNGLQRSTDRGATWSPVASFPYKGRDTPRRPGHWTTDAGLSFVVFDPASGKPGQGSKTLFVGVADTGVHHLWRSDDAGQTWTAIGPDMDLLACKAELDEAGLLYITYCNGMGPNGVTDGAVCRYDTRTGAWKDITPEKPTPEAPGGFMGISVDRSTPGTLAVASMNHWKPHDTVWRSTDRGETWASIFEVSTRDVRATPFLLWGRPQAEIGWWMAGLAIDPFNSNFACYTTGATIYATHEFANVSAREPTLWKPWVEGIEQTAVLTLVSLPKGPPLLSGFGDISGFTHEDLSVSPSLQFTNPVFGNTDVIDYAGLAPNIVVRSGTPDVQRGGATLAWSEDFGRSWRPMIVPRPPGAPPPPPVAAPGHPQRRDPHALAAITTSADGSTFVVATPTAMFTRDRGQTWSPCAGLPLMARPVADRAVAGRFYAIDFSTGRLFVSEDGAASFSVRPSHGLAADLSADARVGREQAWPLKAVPGRPGALWFLSRQGLFRSDDGGRVFARVNSDVAVEMLDFGPSATGRSDPALYAVGRRGDLRAIWRSDDGGRAWLRINDPRHEYGRRFRCIAADQRTFGRVYVGTDGRGILVGDVA
jgi:photosystem II stability/assembly factor-like uncharacterized protein